MKKKLIRPPQKNGEVLFLPGPKEVLDLVKIKNRIGVCHQPYFFNPGVGLKFLFLDGLPKGEKDLIFLDTDRVRIRIEVPCSDGSVDILDLIDSPEVLCDHPAPGAGIFGRFFASLEGKLKKTYSADSEVFSNLLRFKEIIFKNSRRKYLKEVLAESFLEFFGIKEKYCFLSDLMRTEGFEDLFMRIHRDATRFRRIYNNALAEYRDEYRFRYKNYPFPPLEKRELPFWIVKDGERKRCFEDDIDGSGIQDLKIFPRAATLTIFLRLYWLDLFIHGIGGANYEWVQDRIIERFFNKTPPPYAVVSGTFLLNGFKEREFPFFLFSPKKVIESLENPSSYKP